MIFKRKTFHLSSHKRYVIQGEEKKYDSKLKCIGDRMGNGKTCSEYSLLNNSNRHRKWWISNSSTIFLTSSQSLLSHRLHFPSMTSASWISSIGLVSLVRAALLMQSIFLATLMLLQFIPKATTFVDAFKLLLNPSWSDYSKYFKLHHGEPWFTRLASYAFDSLPRCRLTTSCFKTLRNRL